MQFVISCFSVLMTYALANSLVNCHLSHARRTFCADAIYTGDPNFPTADCMTILGDIVLKIFNKTDKHFPSFGEVEIKSGYIFPGLIDSHGHILHYGELLDGVDIKKTKSVDDVIKKLVQHKRTRPLSGTETNWIRGMGWDEREFGGIMPTAKQLASSSELKGLYILLERIDVHCIWVSEAVLNLLPKHIPEFIPGGQIIRSPGMGVFCNNAMDLVYRHLPKQTTDEIVGKIRLASKRLNSLGITAVHDAGILMNVAQIFHGLARQKELTLRVYGMLKCDSSEAFCGRDEGVRMVRTADSMFTLTAVKLFADKTLGSWGAALLEPYSDRPETSGNMVLNETDLMELVAKWYDDGWQVNIHAIGDRANKAVLGAFENVLEPCGTVEIHCNRRRLRIEHAQILAPEDQVRISKLAVLASIQPTHATSDMWYAIDRLGPKRLEQSAFRQKSLLQRPNVHVLLGSDFPVEPPNPFHGMYAAVNRLSPASGTSPHGENGWYPEEKLTVEEAFSGFTKGAAFGAFWEGKAGCLKEGSWADWVVVHRNFLADVGDLRDVKVEETWVAGKKVFWRLCEDSNEGVKTDQRTSPALQQAFSFSEGLDSNCCNSNW